MKSNRGIKTLTVSLIMFLAINTGCFYDEVIPAEPEGEISYLLEIQPIFNAKCIACHAGAIAPDLGEVVSHNELISGGYIDTGSPENSLLYTKINVGGSMESYASDIERATILRWIEQGAKNN